MLIHQSLGREDPLLAGEKIEELMEVDLACDVSSKEVW